MYIFVYAYICIYVHIHTYTCIYRCNPIYTYKNTSRKQEQRPSSAIKWVRRLKHTCIYLLKYIQLCIYKYTHPKQKGIGAKLSHKMSETTQTCMHIFICIYIQLWYIYIYIYTCVSYMNVLECLHSHSVCVCVCVEVSL